METDGIIQSSISEPGQSGILQSPETQSYELVFK